MIEDYSIYRFPLFEYIQYLIKGTIIGIALGILFYSNIIGVLLLAPYGFIYVKKQRNELAKKQMWQLNLEFLDGLASLSGALSAGYAVENAFGEALKDLKLIYPKDSFIVNEFNDMVYKLNNNITLEEVLYSFSNRSGLEDIKNFSEVFITAKHTGGDLVKIIRNTSKTIHDKVEVKREIITMITAKRFEAKVMNVIPMGIVAYLRIFSPGFLKPLYHNLFGFLFMTLILILYYIALYISDKIMDIEV